jgi:hypothetical protein
MKRDSLIHLVKILKSNIISILKFNDDKKKLYLKNLVENVFLISKTSQLKYLLILTLLVIGTSSFAQQKQTKFSYYGNTIGIKIEEAKDENYEVFISNETNDNWSKKIVVSNQKTQAEFEKEVIATIKKLMKSYTFKSSSIDSLVIDSDTYANINILPTKDPVTAKFTDVIYKGLTANEKVLEKRFKDAVGFKNHNDFIKRLGGGDDQKITDSGLDIKKNEDAFEIKEMVFTSKEPLGKKLDSLANKDLEFLKMFYNDKDIEEALSNKTSQALLSQKLAGLYESKLGKEGYKFIGNYMAKDTNIIYAISIKQDAKGNFFTLRFQASDSIGYKYTVRMAFKIDQPKFKSVVTSVSTGERILKSDEIARLYEKCNQLNEEAYKDAITAPHIQSFDSLVKAIENAKTEYSGILKLNSEVTIFETDTSQVIKNRCLYNVYGQKPLKKKFRPEYATVRFFNNRAKNIVIVGNVVDKLGEVIHEHVSVNPSWSITIRSFNSNKNSISVSDKHGKRIGFINYNEVFQYYPYEEKFNYAVKNKEYRIAANDSVNVEQRKLADYFTPVIFSDFLGLDSGSENGLLFAEGRAKIPVWLNGTKIVTMLSALRADVNVALYNGFDENSRLIEKDGRVSYRDTTLTINPFEYVKHSNINAGISFDVFNFEFKSLGADLSLGGGIRYYRAGIKYIATNIIGKDEEHNDQLNALAPEINTNFQIRPQTNFGADLLVAYSWLHARGTKNDIKVDVPNGKDKKMLRLNLDLYSKVNPDQSNGGIYARLGGYYHVETKDFYPQIMVGYATNLSSFVNKFRKDNGKIERPKKKD